MAAEQNAESVPSEASSEASAKDRFREALERKRAGQHANNGTGHGDSKVHAAHDRAGNKRTFRRKSG